jgi:hypothetical protein
VKEVDKQSDVVDKRSEKTVEKKQEKTEEK